ncbi:sulfite exporter TauE/SafE family protein [Helicobacter aurati]|uniref:Probable membrane transporter protein n=1 Tax=Helicobacter aurati TaxID=137778 RepID=A0A3D8J971_9HELI|nr:sulfite exporter TauE/SafE family protein [Helicobacter aurati]RDU73745.1 sulfite exporter TauE/SafE family protein [Helicobacter aurati]
MEYISLAILGIITGAISALFGIGGGMIIVPCMLYIHYLVPSLDFSSHAAVGISVMQMVFSSFFGSFLNVFKKKNIDLKEALFLGLGGSIGASFSGFILAVISSKNLMTIFLLVSCYTFYKFLARPKPKYHDASISTQKKYIILVIIGALTGVFAISLGIGGGVIMTPLLAYYLKFATKKIVALSLFFIACASCTGSLSFLSHGIMTESVYKAGIVLGAFSLIGVLIGSKLIESISLKLHRQILICLYLVSILATLHKVLSYHGL